MPNRRIFIRDAAVGGFLAALAFEAMKRGFTFYITQFPTYKLVYGAFASAPIFLLWVYLSWVVVLSGFGAAIAEFGNNLPATLMFVDRDSGEYRFPDEACTLGR